MKKLLFLPIILFTTFFFISCEDSTTDPGGEVTTGTLFVQSTPAGAQIWVDGSNSGKVTPDSVKNLSAGTHSLTLKLDGYKDSVQTGITITAGSTTQRTITLTRASLSFGPVIIWETVGTTASQPSGLDLSTGIAIGIGASVSGRANVDIYYDGTDFKIHSASAVSGLTRVSSFFIGSGTNLDDGVNSPTKDNTWVSQMPDTKNSNYVFIFDNDSHYSKLRITDQGGGTPGNPAWVEVQLIYNEQANSKVF
jgi:hypothetical protein